MRPCPGLEPLRPHRRPAGQRLVEQQLTVRLVLVPNAGYNLHQERPAEALSAMV